MDILAGLNPAQKEAVEAINGPVLILAGPGSGKTRVITHRVAYLIRTTGISPHRIMAVTFTNKAAREMVERLKQLIGETAVGNLTIGTFHAICARILRQDGRAIGIDPRFVIYDDDDQMGLVKQSTLEAGLDPKQFVPRAIASAISAAKSHLITPQDFVPRTKSYFEEVVGRVYERYQKTLTDNNGLDFDDLLMRTVLLFKNSPETLAKYQARYMHVLVDEFQDTNVVQYELIKQLGGKRRNVCVVGDPDQSIYSWRFADLRNILSFEKDFPETKIVILEQNYRSTKRILETASSVISANKQRKPKSLWTDNEEGELINMVETFTEQEEAQFVVSEIDRLVSAGKAKLSDCAVMYRTNAQSRALEEAFIRYGTPYRLVAATRFYERREVKDIVAYLRLVQNPNDNISLQRILNVPGRGIGQVSAGHLASWAKSLDISQFEALKLLGAEGETTKPPFTPRTARTLLDFFKIVAELSVLSQQVSLVDLFDRLIKDIGYQKYVMADENGEERWENILELRAVAHDYATQPPGEGLSAFLEAVTLVSDVDTLKEALDVVTLVTLHQAKGLEYPVVFIVGVEDGILPHFKSMDDPTQLEEERRLFYVGITRAKQRIYLVYSFRRHLMGSTTVSKPSRFLEDIPRHLVANSSLWQGEDGGQTSAALYTWNRKPAAAPRPALDLPELKDGDHVRHGQFGEGLVVSSRPSGDDVEMVVAFGSGVGIKKLLLSFARLEKIDKNKAE
jgi:DNA helicase II / ATP-dependent DNA helicase PcrA